MKTRPEMLSIESRDIIERKLREKREEFLIKNGFLKEKNLFLYEVESESLKTSEVIEKMEDDFKGLKKQFEWLLEGLEGDEIIQFKKDGLIGDKKKISRMGRRVIIQLIDKFIASEISSNPTSRIRGF